MVLLILTQGAYAQEGEGDEFPLVWVSATDMLFAGGPSGAGYSNVFHLAYKYSSDWVLVIAEEAFFSENTIAYRNGNQYSFDKEGKILGEMEFTEFLEAVDYASMESASLGDDGSILTPFTGPEIGFAVAQAEDGLLKQIALARDAEEYMGNLHLYDGFLYQFGDGMTLETQIAFSEISFSTKGLLRSSVVVPQLETTEPPTIETYHPTITPFESTTSPDAGGTLSEAGNETVPGFTIPVDYDVPPIKKIGVVMFSQHAGRGDLIIPATEELADALGDIEGLEVKTMAYDADIWGGGLLYERAVELGEENDVDAFIISDLTDFDYPDDIELSAFVTDVKVACEIEFAIIDCTGGRIFWRTMGDDTLFINYGDFEEHEESISLSVIREAIKEGVSRLISDDVLAGGPIDKGWEDEG